MIGQHRAIVIDEDQMMIRSILLWLATALLVVISYWNVWSFDRIAGELPPRNSQNEVASQNNRYEGIRNLLLAEKYQVGTIGFITNRDLNSQKNTAEDDFRWSQVQFILVPWVVLRGTRSVSGYDAKIAAPLVIGDFWDGTPAELPPDLVKLYETKDGLILFRRRFPE